MISKGWPPILPPRCSLASSTERRMSSPIAACGPVKVLMKPILIGAWAMAGCRPPIPKPAASAAIVAAPNNLLVMSSLPVSVCVYNSRKHSGTQFVALDLAGRGLGQIRHVFDPARVLVGRQRGLAERHQLLGQSRTARACL